MKISVKLPQLSMLSSECLIGEWHVQVGSAVEAGTVLCDVESGKITDTIKAPAAGTITEICAESGASVAMGGKLCTISTD